MDARKKIALLVAEPDQMDQNNFIEGMLKQAFSYDYDVCVFAMYKMYQETTEREMGESKIFSLMPMDAFDACIVLADSIQASGVVKQIENELHAYFDGPVLFVNKKSEYFPTVYMDDYTLMKALVEHMCKEHGYRDLAYLTGKAKDYHTQDRLQAYRDCLKECGIGLREDRIYYGDYWYSSGESMVDRLMKNPDDLPEGIVCANDCMAVGVAAALVKAGIQVPEQVAVVGFDYSQEAMTSPSPITAVKVPYYDFGMYVADCVNAQFRQCEFPEFCVATDLFIGKSCGCEEYQPPRASVLRSTWDTDNSKHGFFAKFNPMMEDLMCQTKLQDLYNTIFSYTYQIRDFENFYLCLNKYWASEESLVSLDNDWKNYTDEMLMAIQCGPKGANLDEVSMSRLFDTSEIIPELKEARMEPKAYFFTPVFFEDQCMGYSVLSFGSRAQSFGSTYRLWMKNVMRGLECFRRLQFATLATVKLESSEYVDGQIGIANYKGFMHEAESFVGENVELQLLAVDIVGLAKINRAFGREEGDRAIVRVAQLVQACETAKWCCCLGNDEFLMASDESGDFIEKMQEELTKAIDKANENHTEYAYEVCFGRAVGKVTSVHDVRHLIDDAVSSKNGNKTTAKKELDVITFTDEEEKVADIVKEILDENLLVYHYQPIIDAKTGDIFSYEALMRSNTDIWVSPLDIIKYAKALNRLYDVEHYTFFNITKQIMDNEELFAGKRVFINSIPGAKLSEEDMKQLDEIFLKHPEQIVIELTEQAELDDEMLASVKAKFNDVGVEMAIDDYGTGYSNVTNLLRYMPRYVKIDRMLLSEIQNSPQKQHFVREIVSFAHNNNIMALAEGVETAEELEMVIHLGADLIQGYYVAKPSAEIIPAIPVKIKREVQQFHLQEQYNKNARLYVAGKEFRIVLANLASEEYECIFIPGEEATYRDLNIVGVPSIRTNIQMKVGDGYHGRITLENVGLGGKRGQACITLGDNCDVTLVLKGENELRTGGILVPETSKLTFEGDGSVFISCNYDNYFGIGNDLEHAHGELFFEQDGTVEVQGNGTCGVAIGSGKGGKIHLISGKTITHMTGKKGVAVGCINGETEVEVMSCDLFMDGSVYAGVGIGAMEGKVVCSTKHIAINGRFNGTDWVGIGAHVSKNSEISIHNCSVTLSLHALKVCGVGSFEGPSHIDVKYAAVNLNENGDLTLAVGDTGKESVLDIQYAELALDTDTDNDFFVGILDENRHDESGGNIVIRNRGVQVFHNHE